MKITFVANQFFFFRHIDPIASDLVKRGHQVSFWFGNLEKSNITDRAVSLFIESHSDLASFRRLPKHIRGKFRYLHRVVRELLGYHTYLVPGFTSSNKKQVFESHMSAVSKWLVNIPIARRMLRNQRIYLALRKFLAAIPVDFEIMAELQEEKPDILVAVTNLREDINAPELEYIKAALRLGIKAVDLVASWDNLSTKSTFNVIPDGIILWNQFMLEEAVELHRVPAEKIIVSGAETFDYLFDIRTSSSHSEFCKKIGFNEDKPFVVYLGSSSSMTGDETEFVREFVKILRTELSIDTLIRPHPLNAAIWNDFEEPGAVIWPRNGELPDTSQTQTDLWDTFHHSSAVIGINTSAMIEAAIVDRPCVTIRSSQYSASQSETGHFRHLLNGGFLEIADDFDQAVCIIRNIMNGEDRLSDKRRDFVFKFIRPNGINQPVGTLIAQSLELLVGDKSTFNNKAIVNTIDYLHS
jgi:hypothetical protein